MDDRKALETATAGIGAWALIADGDVIYHAARVARDALRKRDGGERFLAVRRALSPLAVMVSREADGRIRLHRPDTRSDFYMGKAE